jgi:uncharacterized membrane protein (UPF0127 family)
MKVVQIINLDHPEIKIHANWCSSFFANFKGLMFVKSIPDFSGILLVENSESRINTSIHMLFMNFDITAVWINSGHEVVDVVLAKKWHLAYFPKNKAQFVLEINSSHLNDIHVGDHLQFENEK